MADRKPDRATQYHNKGQEDAAKGPGNHNPPHNGAGFFSPLFHSKQDVEDIKNYNEGHAHGRDQRK